MSNHLHKPKKIIKLNLACGDTKFDDFINIDINRIHKPDVIANIGRLPFATESVKVITLFHVIEHVKEGDQPPLLKELNRVLALDGIIYISYPEFSRCSYNYLNNVRGDRDFWKLTIFGRQQDIFDYHVSLMDTRFFVPLLRNCGFKDIESRPEPETDFNTIVKARKKSKPVIMQEDVLRETINGSHLRYDSPAGIS